MYMCHIEVHEHEPVTLNHQSLLVTLRSPHLVVGDALVLIPGLKHGAGALLGGTRGLGQPRMISGCWLTCRLWRSSTWFITGSVSIIECSKLKQRMWYEVTWTVLICCSMMSSHMKTLWCDLSYDFTWYVVKSNFLGNCTNNVHSPSIYT